MTNRPPSLQRLGLLAIVSTVLFLWSSHHSTAQPSIGGIGFGIMVPEPVAFTIKGGMGSGNAWDAAIGTSKFGNIRIHAEYLWNINAFSSREVGLYLGVGGIIGFGRGKGVVFRGNGGEVEEDATSIGIRGVFGLNAFPFTAPVELFVEIAPIFRLAPDSYFLTEAAVGVRYYP